MKLFAILLSFAALAFGQDAGAGYSAPWDVKRLLEALSAEAQRLKPIIAQTDPAQWSDKDAAQAYAAQWKSTQNLIQYFTGTTQNLAKQPEKLPLALETYFRMEAMETSLGSLAEGIRKYQNPAIADLLRGVMTENSNNREKLKQYLTDLATARDQEFQIADKEAQRCRATINRIPPPAPSRGKKQE